MKSEIELKIAEAYDWLYLHRAWVQAAGWIALGFVVGAVVL